MNLRSALTLAIVAPAAATRTFMRPGSNLSANSALGSRLLSKARRLDQDEYDFTWAADYSIVFHSCHDTLEFRADAGGQSNDNSGNPTETNRMVLFKLCPSDKCGAGCKGGEYLVEMREFVESYMESKEGEQEYACEQVKDNCSCEDDDSVNDDDVCLAQCYAAAGLDGCEEDQNNGDDDWDFELERYLECEAINEDDDGSSSLYVGAYCSSNGKNIYLGSFADRQCTQKVAKGTFESFMGREMPYASESLIGNDCISCTSSQNDGDDDGVQVNEFCEDIYERSAKCEKHLNIDNKVTGGCDYIHNILPKMEALASGSAQTSTVLAWLFGLTTLAASGAAFFFYTQSQRGNVQLSSQGDGNLA